MTSLVPFDFESVIAPDPAMRRNFSSAALPIHSPAAFSHASDPYHASPPSAPSLPMSTHTLAAAPPLFAPVSSHSLPFSTGAGGLLADFNDYDSIFTAPPVSAPQQPAAAPPPPRVASVPTAAVSSATSAALDAGSFALAIDSVTDHFLAHSYPASSFSLNASPAVAAASASAAAPPPVQQEQLQQPLFSVGATASSTTSGSNSRRRRRSPERRATMDQDKLEERRRKNRASSQKCYYNRKRKIEEVERTLTDEKQRAIQLYTMELQLRNENAYLKKELVLNNIPIPSTFLTSTRTEPIVRPPLSHL